MASREIPIRNIYYLLLYAWGQWSEGAAIDIDAIESPELVDLFAGILVQGTNHVMRRGLDQGYHDVAEDTARVKGKIDFAETTRKMLLQRSQVNCRFDELSPDILSNQILKSTLAWLLMVRGLNSNMRSDLDQLRRRLGGIQEIKVRREHFRRVQLYGNNAFYRFLLNVCELIHENLLPTESSGHLRFKDFRKDDVQMWRIFESFVARFYEREQDVFRVLPQKQILWSGGREEHIGSSRLPTMNVDVVLERRDQAILLDTKFYRDTLQTSHYRSTLRSDNLYQMFAYLKNASVWGGPYTHAEGILLYPTVKYHLDERVILHGHPVRLVTVDLGGAWPDIHESLLEVVGVGARGPLVPSSIR
jgi:5-methylcytosine-specific restriction enzyme subunit McrC